MAKDYSNEKWLPIGGFEGLYEISTYGRVKQLPRQMSGKLSHLRMKTKIKRPLKHCGGYKTSVLCTNNRFMIHRLVAIAFIPNPKNYPIVNHKNLKKNDNHVDNLEWCTHQHNTRHYYASHKAKTKSKKKTAFLREYAKGTRYGVNVYKDGVFVEYFESVPLAAKGLKIKGTGNIYCFLRGRYTHCGGYTFEKVPNPNPYQPKTNRTNKGNKAKGALSSLPVVGAAHL